jgi:hypothetical protein
MSKGLGIKVIGGMTLALVGVSILLAAFSSNFGGASGIYCSTYDSISVVFPGKNSPPPEGCGEGRTVEYQVVEADTVDEFNLRLSNAVISCYDRYQGYNTSEFCEGWNVKGLPDSVDEENFTAELAENNLCPETIENSDFEDGSTGETCGSSNQIYFEKDEISSDDFIVIEYNTSTSGTQRVEVG